MKNRTHWLMLVGVVVIAAIMLAELGSAAGKTTMSTAQDPLRLDNRITQLEQRIYSIETSIRTLEQQSRLAGVSSRTVSPEEVALIRSEMQTLQRRLIDAECGIIKLDERTLSPERKRRSLSDPCRQNSETPVRLVDRQ